jgi:hypothetical protein
MKPGMPASRRRRRPRLLAPIRQGMEEGDNEDRGPPHFGQQRIPP